MPPGSTAEYPITYAPKTMATQDAAHVGSVFFPFPNGSAKLFSLAGVANPPAAAGNVTEDVPSKTSHYVQLSIHNWLNVAQRFRAEIERSSPEDESTTLKGPQYIDVPALSERVYKLNFFAYKPGQTTAKVTFTNERTGEYLFYNVTFNAGNPSTLSTIKLQCPVRGRVFRSVTITNPTAESIVLTPSCDHKQIFFPEDIELKAKADTEVRPSACIWASSFVRGGMASSGESVQLRVRVESGRQAGNRMSERVFKLLACGWDQTICCAVLLCWGTYCKILLAVITSTAMCEQSMFAPVRDE